MGIFSIRLCCFYVQLLLVSQDCRAGSIYCAKLARDLGNSGSMDKVNHDFTEQLLFKIKQGQGHHK